MQRRKGAEGRRLLLHVLCVLSASASLRLFMAVERCLRRSLLRHSLAGLDDEGGDADIFGEAVVIEQDAVAEHFGHEMPYVLEGHVRAAFGERPHARGADERLHGAWARAPLDEALDIVA